MGDFPRTLDLEPITDWPGDLTTRRIEGQFKTTPGENVKQLHAELAHLKGKNPRLLIAVLPEQLRKIDGRLRAGEKPWHPGVILEFDTPDGKMRFPSDGYRKWEDNLRAVVLTLRALRDIDRWRVTTGQQYGGFLALEQGRAAGSAGVTSLDGALAIIGRILSTNLTAADLAEIRPLVRAAQRVTHPDTGGDAGDFAQLEMAETYLRNEGHL